MNYFLFKLRRFIARTFHWGCQICRDGKVEMNWWHGTCPICWRKFPSPNGGDSSETWHEYLNPYFDYEEWKKLMEERNE